MTAHQLTREQDLWVKMLMVKPEWSYAEAIYWIVYRSGEAIGAHLLYGRSPILRDRPDIIAGICHRLAIQEGLPETKPGETLELALLAGDVRAWAEPADASLPTNEFTPTDWQHLVFQEVQPGMSGWIDTRQWSARHHVGRYVNMRFGREGVMAAFPARTNAAADGSHLRLVAVGTPEAPSPLTIDGKLNAARLNRSARKWLAATDVCEVASGRVRERGGDPSDEREMRQELKAMLREQNWHVNDASVDAIRNDAGYKVRKE